MKTIGVKFIGRWGNQLFQYAYARALAEHNGYELHTEPWVGQRVFALEDPLRTGREDIILQEIDGYRQRQEDLIYSRTEIRSWLKFKKRVAALADALPARNVIHLRRGDYASAGYPLVSLRSAYAALAAAGYEGRSFAVLSDDWPSTPETLEPDLGWLPDWLAMVRATTLVRANSSFSWWAATLANPAQELFAPVIDGLAGGLEHDCKFVRGNWPRLANLEFTTDLVLQP